MHSRHKNVAGSFKHDWIDLRKSCSPVVKVQDVETSYHRLKPRNGADSGLESRNGVGSIHSMRGSLTLQNQQIDKVHQRLYKEHVEFKQRRQSQYDPGRREREEEILMCTFKPSLEKSLKNSYMKTRSVGNSMRASIPHAEIDLAQDP